MKSTLSPDMTVPIANTHNNASRLNIFQVVDVLLTPEPNGVGEGVYGIDIVLRRRRRRRDAVSVWTP